MKSIYKQIEEISKYKYILGLIQWDLETEMPKKAQAQTAAAVSFVAEKMYDEMTSTEFVTALKSNEKKPECSPLEKKMIEELLVDVRKMEKIPKDEYVAYQELLNHSHTVWIEAKTKSDFKIFEPYLTQIIDFQKKLIGYYGYKEHPYDALLNDYEPGFTVAQAEELFSLLKEKLLPLLKKIQTAEKQIRKVYAKDSVFSKEGQQRFGTFIAEYIGFDYDAGVLKESEHPFSMSLDKNNIRMTTHYYLDNVESSISSIMHETGHSLYEQGVADELVGTMLDEGTSLGIHESQSRFYENIVGRDQRFWEPIYNKLQAEFPEQLNAVSCTEFVEMLNRVEASFIRVEADELTYPFHVMIRYEIEKMLFEEKITVSQMPEVWNRLYKEYLGLDVPNDAIGVLQDVHWSMGSFGYFPTYVVGSAYASQIEQAMSKKIDMDAALSGELKQILVFLRENVHQYGKSKSADEIIIGLSGESFNPEYYINYLHEKFSKLYNLSE